MTIYEEPYMSLRQWKKSEDLRLREVAAQEAVKAKLWERAVHPIVRAGCDRNVRDAYFLAVIYAGYCDDLKVDPREGAVIREIGASLGLDGQVIQESIWYVGNLDNSHKVSLYEECLEALGTLKPVELARLFAAEFVRVRLVNPANEAEIPEDLSEIAATCGFESGNLLDAVKRVVVSHSDDVSMVSLDVLSKFLGDEGGLYFACKGKPDADEQLQRYRAQRAKKESEYGDPIDDRDEDDSSDAVARPLHSCVTCEAIEVLPREGAIVPAESAQKDTSDAGECFYRSVVDWLATDAHYGHMPQGWKNTLREKYDGSGLTGGFLVNAYQVLIRHMKELLPAINGVIEGRDSFEDNVWKVVLIRMDDSYKDRIEYNMFLALSQALIVLSHGEDFVGKFDGGPLLLMKADENGHVFDYEWIDKWGWNRDTAEWFWLKGKYVRCEIGEFRWDHWYMNRSRAQEVAKTFFQEIIKQIEKMFVDIV